MDNFFKSALYKRIVILSTACTFTLGTLPTTQGYAENVNNDFQGIQFAIRMEKLIKKINHYKDKMDQKKIIETLLDIKHEVEGYTGKKIDIEKELKQVEKAVAAKGGKLHKDDLKKISKLIKESEKKHNHKVLFMKNCMESGINYEAELAELDFIAKHGHDNTNNEVNIPIKVTVGVTIALCGVFLLFVPVPVCQLWAPRIIASGATIAADGLMERMEDDRKK